MGISVAYACDDNYATLTAVSVVSLLQHNPGASVTLLGCGLMQESIDLVRSRAEKFGSGDFRYIDVGPMIQQLKRRGVSSYVSYAVYSRIYIADVLATDHGRILYLDCDTLVNDSLEELFAVDLAGQPIGLAPDCVCRDYYQVIKLPCGKRYFNSGVMLIDLDAWRRCACTRLLLDEIEHPHGPNPLGDQDVIVRALNDLITPLAPRWNFLSQYFLLSYSGVRSIVGRQEGLWASEEDYLQAQAHPAIYHFSGNTLGRPWAPDSRHPILRQYREVAFFADVSKFPRMSSMSIPYKVQYILWRVLPQRLFELVAHWMLKLHIRLNYRQEEAPR